MNYWKLIPAILVIFGAGAVTGGLLVSHSDKCLGRLLKTAPTEKTQPSASTNTINREKIPAPLKGPLRKDFLERLEKEIKLTPQQSERIEKIIHASQENTQALWDVIESDIYAELVNTKASIRDELTPEQKVRFAELLNRRPNPRPTTNQPPAVNAATNPAPAKP